ncbi:MAG TPA: YoaK family protein [Bryobacteraceae bacterium]|jgi:uncharacterized membrane protein YoaK (UPF0700 family)|nr:YoaK family protein [Bryobacteraceae bacterium]
MSWAAGLIDAVGWLALLHVYAAHMTGNTAAAGVNLFGGDWEQASRHAWPIVPFVLGLLFSAGTTAAARRHGWHSSFSIALFTELALLAAFMWFGMRYSVNGELKQASNFYALIALPAAAMGIQTVTVTRVAGLRVYTTYLTGSLAKFAEAATQYAFWFYDRTRGRLRKRLWKALQVTPRHRYARHAALTAVLWLSYIIGAFCGAFLHNRYGLLAVLAALIVLVIAILIDLISPVAAADEPGSFDDS